jgi:hypothetical protein
MDEAFEFYEIYIMAIIRPFNIILLIKQVLPSARVFGQFLNKKLLSQKRPFMAQYKSVS